MTPVISTLLYAVAAAATCYWPNGNADANYVPCPNSRACCLKGESCLSNGLCYGAKLNVAYRGACADKSWPADQCPPVCLDSVPDHRANLYSCPNSSANVFTCGYADWATDVCNANLGQWEWVSGGVSVAENGASGLVPTSAPVSASASASVSKSVGIVTATSTGTTVITTGADTTGTGIPQIPLSGSVSAFTIGAGLGLGLGVPLLLVSAVLIFFFVRMRRQMRQTKEVNEKADPVVFYQPPVGGARQSYHRPTELEGSENLPELGA